MARRGKVGIEYFSHDVDMMQDKKMKILRAKHGLVGYAVFLRLLEDVYRNGYYLLLDEDANILFVDDNNLDYNVYILILNECINVGLFDKNIFEKYSIITSRRIQENYIVAIERRKNVELIKDYLLLEPSKFLNKKNNVNIISLNADILTQNDDIGTQSKVKESKVKESKVKESKVSLSEFYSKIPGTRRSLIFDSLVKHGFLDRLEGVKFETAKKTIELLASDNFRDVDIPYQISRCEVWEEKKKRKTPKGLKLFLLNWMDGEQNAHMSSQRVPKYNGATTSGHRQTSNSGQSGQALEQSALDSWALVDKKVRKPGQPALITIQIQVLKNIGTSIPGLKMGDEKNLDIKRQMYLKEFKRLELLK